MKLDFGKNTLPHFSSLKHSRVWIQCGCATSTTRSLTHSHLPVQFIQSKAHGKVIQVSTLCSEVTLTWGQCTHRLCQNQKQIEHLQRHSYGSKKRLYTAHVSTASPSCAAGHGFICAKVCFGPLQRMLM